MTVSITIRLVPESTRDALAARASREGTSLQEFLLGELQRLALEPGVSDWVSSARSFAASAPPDSADHILTGPEKNRH